METLKKDYLCSKFSQEVREEYIKLLSIGKTNEDAETLIIEYFLTAARNRGKEEYLWLTLALCEWEYGRLSQFVKEKVMFWANNDTSISIASRNTLLAKLNSTMPQEKKVRAPRYADHCPWPVGSLLAYRIISSTHPRVTNNTLYGHYVLLRVIKIKRNPVSQLAPNDMWREEMLVGLYNWIGECLPSPAIIDNLEFTAISIRESPRRSFFMPFSNAEMNTTDSIHPMGGFIELPGRLRIETCCSLDWRCAKGIDSSKVFTYISCDSAFQKETPPYFDTDATAYSLCHSIPFDAVLVNRFTQLANERQAQQGSDRSLIGEHWGNSPG